MKKVVICLIILILLAGSATAAYYLGEKSGKAQLPPHVPATVEVANAANTGKAEINQTELGQTETDQTKIDQTGVILFKIEDYIKKESSIILKGTKRGAFLYWTPDEDFVTSDETPAEFEIPNDVIMDYYTGIDYGIVELTGGEVGLYYDKLYKGEFIYLHLNDENVVYIQQAIRTPY